MYDPSNVMLFGVNLLVLVFSIGELFKSLFTMSQKVQTIVYVVTGFVLGVTFRVVPLLPDNYQQIADIIISSLVVGLAAAGFYKFVENRSLQVAALMGEAIVKASVRLNRWSNAATATEASAVPAEPKKLEKE